MISSNYTKFLLLLCAVLLFSSSCRFWQIEPTEADPPPRENNSEQAITIPTKEPEVFQAKIVVTTELDGEKSERNYFIAKNGLKIYTAFNFGEETETAILETGDGNTFFLSKKDKEYRKKEPSGASRRSDELRDFLTTKWLNEKRQSKYEKLGTENDLAKYRVTIDDSAQTEIFVFVDEKLNIPVKQEFYSVSDSKRKLIYSVEVKNFKSEVLDTLFDLPSDYQESQ